MARQHFDSWDRGRVPRGASLYSGEYNAQSLRLPPPSSLFIGVHDDHASSNDRGGALNGQFPHREGYAGPTSKPAHRPTQASIPGPEGAHPALNSSSRPQADGRAWNSSAYLSPAASERSEDSPDFRRRQSAQYRQSPPPPAYSLSSDLAPAHEKAPQQPPQDAQPHPAWPNFSYRARSPVNQMGSQPAGSRGPEPRMKIADILSSEQNQGPTTASESHKGPVCQPERSRSTTKGTSTYRISIRQQPVAARSCGYGERDRRVIDPPPIIQMSIEDPTASEEDIRQRLTHSYSIMHCTIWNETGDQDMSSMPEDYRTQRRLMGTVVSSPFAGYDEHNAYGCFFCFPDLSCRTPGSFRLQFSFMVLDPSSSPGHRTPVAALVMSDIFTVYNAKDFPGMKASTALTKRLKEQGCLISIKKGNDRTRAREESDSDDDSEGEADGGGSGSGRRRSSKRIKR
ncbi:hypothetical protein F4808DRAFT_461527 [Astrocystis sublimbata]|nr:hypothetical protein F4808DRAFT_461527 [Astrocystis sublimbata]